MQQYEAINISSIFRHNQVRSRCILKFGGLSECEQQQTITTNNNDHTP